VNQVQRSQGWRGLGLAIAFYAFIAIGIAEAGLGVLLPSILVAYHLTTATVTVLFVSQISGYIVAALTSSLISAWLGLAPMLLLAASALTLALGIYALSPVWGVMVAAGGVLGLGIGLIDAGINTYMVQDEGRANLIGSLHGFYGIGALSGPAIATTLLALGLGWRQVYGVLAGLVSLLVIGVGGAMLCRYPPMTQPIVVTDTTALEHLWQSLRHRRVLLTGLLLGVYVGVEAAISNWAFMVQTVGRQTPPLSAGYSVSAYWVGLTAGRFLLGYSLPQLGAVRVISLSLGVLLVGLGVWWQVPNPWVSLPLIGLALAAIFPATIWLIPKRVPAAMVPAAVSFASSSASFGAALIPSGLGWVASWAGVTVIPLLLLPLALMMIGLHGWLIKTSRRSNVGSSS
jgi:fucose permease